MEAILLRLDMDVVEAILVRLDVEDVLRCKSVCKSWYNMISTKYFVKVHLKRSCNSNREHGYLRIQLHLEINHMTENDDKLRCFMMVGSCNGLVCISPYSAEFLVTNPSTREVRNLPMLPYKNRTKLCWGFGYDSSTDDYKVVVGYNRSEYHMEFQVLSLKSNKWKLVTDNNCLTYNTRLRFSGFLYEGALHWFVDDMKNKKTIILSFDLSLEKFKEIPQPEDSKYVCDNENMLGMFEECLCIFRYYNINANHCHTWVMRNHGCWQLLPRNYEGNKYAAATTAYTLNCFPNNNWHLCKNDKGDVDLSWQSWFTIGAPIFVKSLVSPLNVKPKKKNNNNRDVSKIRKRKRKAQKKKDKVN
ncbi:F-box/kelch-repeat protein At3g23880-like [Rutidosis leptorrhynchoides]|uniref:F-box/kelch-repeat protein At3g23880-like n=1 Tax=Rutidosis leptorrhynchoides TaxID=125765 RepID=UPI003A99EF6D